MRIGNFWAPKTPKQLPATQQPAIQQNPFEFKGLPSGWVPPDRFGPGSSTSNNNQPRQE